VVTPIRSYQAGTSNDKSFIKHKDNYLVWVIAPYLETQDPNLKYYYDYTQSIAEYEKVFSEVGCEWRWVNMTFDSIEKVIRDIKDHPTTKIPIVINLCDGDESNGIPGISVIHALERHNIAYTGASEYFYQITTSKIPMKTAFDAHRVQTPRWKVIQPSATDSGNLFNEIGDTLIVKPAISAGSMGLSIRNVVSDRTELEAILQEMENGYRGWKLDTGGIFVEQFINGREFTTLVVGSSSDPSTLRVYPPAERVFHGSLPDKERFLSFDRLWETYDNEAPLPDKGLLYNYYEPENELVSKLKQISIDAFKSVGGMGYGRLDIRMDTSTGQLYMLEVNAQCGLSEDENYTSIGAILRFAKKSFTYLIIEIVEDALMRYGAKHKALQ
jgi:D-alanine-D-alanine ligase